MDLQFRSLLLFYLLFANSVHSPSSAELAPLGANHPAPLLDAPDANGIERKLSDLKDRKILVLTFFPRCFTFNCANQLSSFRAVLVP